MEDVGANGLQITNPWLDLSSRQELESAVRAMHPAYSRLTVSPNMRKSKRCYVLSVGGEGARYCLNKGGEHRQSDIYFIVTRNGVCQKCFARKGDGGGCALFRSEPAPIPPMLHQALFRRGVGALPSRRALGVPLLGGALVGNHHHHRHLPLAIEQPRDESSAQAAGADVATPFAPSLAQAPPAPDAKPGRRGKRKAGVDIDSPQRPSKLCKGNACGANGRPIVLAGVKYVVNATSPRAYAGTEEAMRTKRLKHTYKHGPPLTDRQRIEKFLRHVQPTASGGGLCIVSYTRSEIGQALVEAGFIQHARLYPDAWPSCITNLGGSSLRAIALGKF